MELSAKDIYAIINNVRSNPQSLSLPIKEQLHKFQSNTVYRNNQGIKVRTMSGKAAWQDAILILERQKPKGPLEWNQNLSLAAEQYKNTVIDKPNLNPFELIKSICSYQGNISFTINESDTDHTQSQIIAAMIIGDGDQKKGTRTAIFHPLYKQFGCSVDYQNNKIIIYMIFAENINNIKSPNKPQSKQINRSPQSNNQQSNNMQKDTKQKNYIKKQQSKNTRSMYLQKGRQFIEILNKIRKDPKGIIIPLKDQIGKFKDDKVVITQYGSIVTKQGTVPYQDLISELQAQYALPTLREVQGLTLTALEQLLQLEAQVEKPTQADIIIDKFCTHSEGIRSIKLRDIEGMPIQAMVLRLLLGDGDKKRTARRKLLSPICKAIGCAISKDHLVLNVGESARDNKDVIQQYHTSLNHDKQISSQKQEKRIPIKQQKQPIKQQNYPQEKLIVKKVSKSHTQKRGGRTYKITKINLTYQDGTGQQIVEQQLI